MAAIPGSVRVGGFVAPTDSGDTYAVTDDTYNRGGFRPVADTTARDAITADRRKAGMLVRTDDGKFWTLTGGILNANWAEVILGVQINDSETNSTTVTWSVNGIKGHVSTAISDIVSGAGSTLDTLNEIATALANDPNFATTMATALGNRVRFDASQTLTAPQRAQAQANINAADATVVSDLITAIGGTDPDLVASYTTAKT